MEKHWIKGIDNYINKQMLFYIISLASYCCTLTQTYLSAFIHTCIWVCVCMHISISNINVYVCSYIYIRHILIQVHMCMHKHIYQCMPPIDYIKKLFPHIHTSLCRYICRYTYLLYSQLFGSIIWLTKTEKSPLYSQ